MSALSPVFQSHAGSIEANERRLAELEQLVFQSHAGSIEAPMSSSGTSLWQLAFQSHAGSIEARVDAPRAAEAPRVSIPRWFD